MSKIGTAGTDLVEMRDSQMRRYLSGRKNEKTPARFQASTGDALDGMEAVLGTMRNYVVRLEKEAKEYARGRKQASVQKTSIARQEFGRILREAAFALSKEATKYKADD